ncbi:MAG: UDP-glucose 4-epimerase [Chloroflexi bacterium]|nr:UDP-glucose 4-epimerase [Chloroflexota bacterium]|tara:strand:+ start:50019 stop:50933 length:915 start_codon:yes stop_codon:yes gene_type:complete
MKIIVTGGAGFIGAHAVNHLIDDGHRVLVIDDLSTGKLSNLNPKADFENIDITESRISDVIKSFEPSVISHFAAQTSVSISTNNPILDANSNIIGSMKVFDAMHQTECRNFIYINTGGALYGEPKYLPVDEKHPINPISPYGLSKWTAERYFLMQKNACDYVKILRLANVYGPGQDAFGEAGVVSIFSNKILSNEPVTIFGDGKQTRDFVYVSDVVDAFKQALKKDESFSVNISSGEAVSINELYDLMSQISGNVISANYEDVRYGDLLHSVLSNKLATELLGWVPRVDLGQGIKRTLDWHSAN